MTPRIVRWLLDDRSAQILAVYTRARESRATVLSRALLLLAQADGVVDARGRVKRASAPVSRPGGASGARGRSGAPSGPQAGARRRREAG